ncbi:MAG: macrolide family glycosyltransferase, partial [Chloroflexota bacterium]
HFPCFPHFPFFMSTAIFFNIPAHGHTNPTLPLVKELVRRGERVIYYNAEPFRAKVEETGAAFRAYDMGDKFGIGHGADSPLDAMARIMSAAEAVIPAVLDEVRAEQPDYIIYDSMCVWGKQIARILERPAVCSCSIFFVGAKNFAALPRDRAMFSNTFGQAPHAARWLWQSWNAARRIKKRYGVESPTPFDFFGNPGDLTLVYTSRYFQLGGELFDGAFKFVGPSIAPRDDHSDFPFDWLDGGPVIYVSLGTIFNDRPDFFRACLEAFGGARYRVVMAIGNKVAADSLGAIPDNFLLRPHVPQLEILPRVSLFITHGGMNSATESAWYGVPMLVAPQMGDQLVVASRVAQLGAGLLVDSRRFTAQTLREAAEKVMSSETFREQSRAIGQSLREAGGYARAADEVLSFVNHYNEFGE